MLAATCLFQGATKTMYTLGTLTKYADYGMSPQRRLINEGNTVYRVLEPPHWNDKGPKCSDTAKRTSSADAIPERYSIAYFSAPDPATVVEALPCCCGDQAPKRWKSVNAGDYLRRKRAAMYAQEA